MRFVFLVLMILCSCAKSDKLTYFENIAVNDLPLEPPKHGEWRSNHNEKVQTFHDFQKAKKIIPNATQKVIYLLPIGEFSELQILQIEKTRSYLEAFYQLETKILQTFSDEIIPKTKTRTVDLHNKQLLAGEVLENIVLKKKPYDAVAIMGISTKDLYPKPEWNYVFGLASYENGAGVTSVYRFQNGVLNANNFQKSLERLIKIGSHEIGHMFGIRHCLNAVCVMNGTNNLQETDGHCARLCSLCQRKLNSTLKYNNVKRLRDLKKFFIENRMFFELSLLKKDLQMLN